MFNFPDSPTVAQQVTAPNGVVYTWDGVKWTTGQGGGSNLYLPISGGTLSGDLTINSPDGNDLILNAAAGEWPGIEMNIPTGQGAWIGSYVGGKERWEIDLGNGVAESGSNSGSNFQINRYADNGAFIDNAILINRQSGQATFSQPIIAPGLYAGGFVNRLRNGTFDVWQRGVAALPSSQPYTADGWRVVTVGAASTTDLVATARPGAQTRFALRINGAAGLTSSKINQIIESNIAAALAGQTCTFQCWLYNNIGATLTPTFNAGHLSTIDNGATGVIDTTVVLPGIPAASYGQIAYTFAANALWSNGGFVELNFGGQQNGAGLNIQIMEADLRATPGLPLGLTAAARIPPPELRPIHEETLFCQRYFEVQNNVQSQGYYTGAATGWQSDTISWKVTKRASPNIALSNGVAVNMGNFRVGASDVAGFILVFDIVAAGIFRATCTVAASAEI